MSSASLQPRAEVVVDLGAVRHNVATLRDRVAPAALMVVVKADGYGHGMVPVARAAREAGAPWLGVAVAEEALELRAAGDTGRLLTWLAAPGEDYRSLVAADVDVTAASVAQVGEVASGARAAGRTARLHLKADTGMARGGATSGDWPSVVAAAVEEEREGSVSVAGLFSHLACADEPAHPANDAQEQAFRAAVAVAEGAGLRPEVVHLANSAAALTRPGVRFDLVRCGLAAYGLSPVPEVADSAALGLRPAMTARSRVALAKRVPAGTAVSYGHHYVTAREATLAVVPVGYADGVLRSGSSTAPVAVAGRRRAVSGRVCMDQFVVDCGDDPVVAGDEVVLFGDGTDGVPTAEEWARACGTISYEIVCRTGGRFRRRHVDEEGR